MVNRELIRAKIVQLVYAYYMSGGEPMDVAIREVETSLEKANELYYVLLALIVAIAQEEQMRYELLCQQATREDRKLPIKRTVNNRFARQLRGNKQLENFLEKNKQDWRDDLEVVRHLCDLIEQTDTYEDYLETMEDNYETDRELWRKLYKQVVAQNDILDALLEEKCLYWNDDKTIVDTFILKTIKRFSEDAGDAQELLPEEIDTTNSEFARSLFVNTIEHKEEYQDYMEQASKNWELGRMPFIDIVIMQIAIAEMISFVEIPLSVTINEYVELSKAYSTPKSGTFINAMLDNIARMLIDEHKILKQL